MCGLAGIWAPGDVAPAEDRLRSMADRLVHRGPDSGGTWSAAGIGLAHRRLSILDLEGGAQPLCNEDGSIWIAFNGEIYNHRELREGLSRPHEFKTRCDTEVLVHLYEERGVDMLPMLRGFFAIALWDRRRERLLLARDPLGKKPLYVAREGNRALFASEPRALLGELQGRPGLDPAAIRDFLALRCVPGRRSGWSGIERVLPGEAWVFDGDEPKRHRFWIPPAPEVTKLEAKFGSSREERFDTAAQELGERLDRAVERRLESDVPLGLLLSGGLDSIAVLASMARVSSEAVRTFTVGFSRASESEATQAEAAAKHFGAEHRTLPLSEQDLIDHVATVLPHLDEPFGDPSFLPTTLICERARGEVTVCLTGDGGDELFGGYDRYARILGSASIRTSTPWRLRLASKLPLTRSRGARWSRALLDRGRTPEERYAHELVSLEAPLRRTLLGEGLRPDPEEPGDALEARLAAELEGPGPMAARAMHHDLGNNLPDFILQKTDRASMARSLELRSPFLDVDLVEWSQGLPLDWKVTSSERKRLLRRLLHQRVPPRFIGKQKRGFGTPLGRWFRHELRGYLHDHLDDAQLVRDGWIDGKGLAAMLGAHRRKRRNFGEALWCLLALEVWYRTWVRP